MGYCEFISCEFSKIIWPAEYIIFALIDVCSGVCKTHYLLVKIIIILEADIKYLSLGHFAGLISKDIVISLPIFNWGRSFN